MIKLMYITNNPRIAALADEAGVDRIFVDLETVGKQLRQGGMNTVQSDHTLADIRSVRPAVKHSELLVRVNPIYDWSREEIDAVIGSGADTLMLPYFQTAAQVEKFLSYVNGRARTILLVETPEAVENLDEILALPGIDECHIGLNDLHLGYGRKFLFELLADGTVDRIAEKFKARGIPFGIGGIARLGKGVVPAEYILAEHIRLGSEAVILSRSFCNDILFSNRPDREAVFAGIRRNFSGRTVTGSGKSSRRSWRISHESHRHRCIAGHCRRPRRPGIAGADRHGPSGRALRRGRPCTI